MRLLEHANNGQWWKKKVGEANSRQVAEFAWGYQLVDPGAWAVVVTEGTGWIGAGHVKGAMSATRAEGAVAVWISNGLFAQCIWRAGK